MRQGFVFGETLREVPAEAEMTGHVLLLRAGMIRKLAAGVYNFLPMGYRIVKKIGNIIRDEMNRIDGQELLMPIIHPAELWMETGRYSSVGSELIRFKDRKMHDFVLAMTHEETITDLARYLIRSHKQLPMMAYQIQTKIRDEARPRGGLLRMREFTMKDAYSFHADYEDLDLYYPRAVNAYTRIFQRCGLETLTVEAASGIMGGTGSHEFMLVSEHGEDEVCVCSECDYKANSEVAASRYEEDFDEKEEEVQIVDTPGVKTIAQLMEFFSSTPDRFLKTVMYRAGKKLVAAVIRGDLEINEAKLTGVLGTGDIELADDEILLNAGVKAGFVSPMGLKDVLIIADKTVLTLNNFIAGANEIDRHCRGVNYKRDFKADRIEDIALVRDGDVCPMCGASLRIRNCIEMGHTFKLGDKYSKALNASFLDKNGATQSVIMGCYGIGLDRLMAAAAENHNDKDGLIWPISIAPFQVHLLALGKSAEMFEAAERLYSDFQEAGHEVLFDDRRERPGVKFKDADLIGCPIRVVVSDKTIRRNEVEVKFRDEDERVTVEIDRITQFAGEAVRRLMEPYK